jgi:hypothetical protein
VIRGGKKEKGTDVSALVRHVSQVECFSSVHEDFVWNAFLGPGGKVVELRCECIWIGEGRLQGVKGALVEADR